MAGDIDDRVDDAALDTGQATVVAAECHVDRRLDPVEVEDAESEDGGPDDLELVEDLTLARTLAEADDATVGDDQLDDRAEGEWFVDAVRVQERGVAEGDRRDDEIRDAVLRPAGGVEFHRLPVGSRRGGREDGHGRQPFVAPDVMPRISDFCMSRYTMRLGMRASRAPNSRTPGPVCASVRSTLRATVRV